MFGREARRRQLETAVHVVLFLIVLAAVSYLSRYWLIERP